MSTTYPLIILGSGPAGYTAALYAARANLRPVLITGKEEGGQLMTTERVDNWPTAVEGVMGQDLMALFARHAERFGAQIVRDHIHKVELKESPFVLYGGEEYRALSLIIATGASAKYLGLPSEARFKGNGVSACATCDGFFYRNKEVAVIGGGSTALTEALYLSNMAKKVYLVHRRDTFRAEAILVEELQAQVAAGKIELKLNQIVEEIKGKDDTGVDSLLLASTVGEEKEKVPVPGVFIAIGHHPNTELFEGQLERDAVGHLITRKIPPNITATNIAGVFAAGDVQDAYYRQAITSAASGCAAALDAESYLRAKKWVG